MVVSEGSSEKMTRELRCKEVEGQTMGALKRGLQEVEIPLAPSPATPQPSLPLGPPEACPDHLLPTRKIASRAAGAKALGPTCALRSQGTQASEAGAKWAMERDGVGEVGQEQMIEGPPDRTSAFP